MATTTKTAIERVIPVERQKAAQAAGEFALGDLPGALAKPAAAVRVGKTAKQDAGLRSVRTLAGIAKITPRQILVNYGKSEQRWAQVYDRRQSGTADLVELLSFARQIIGVDAQGRLRICLMGHAGSKWGTCEPLWAVDEDVVLTVQPNDVLLRFDDVVIEERRYPTPRPARAAAKATPAPAAAVPAKSAKSAPAVAKAAGRTAGRTSTAAATTPATKTTKTTKDTKATAAKPAAAPTKATKTTKATKAATSSAAATAKKGATSSARSAAAGATKAAKAAPAKRAATKSGR